MLRGGNICANCAILGAELGLVLLDAYISFAREAKEKGRIQDQLTYLRIARNKAKEVVSEAANRVSVDHTVN